MRAGPKPEITAGALDLGRLPKTGGGRAIAFIEKFIRVPAGVGVKKPMRLRPWQRAILHGLFDTPRPRQGLVSLPRGNGKSTLAAAMAVYALLGDDVEAAQVLCVASDERQAGIIFSMARRMVELEPRLTARTQIFQDRLYIPATDSTLRTLPAEPGGLQGWNPSFCVVDELHVVTREVWEAISTTAGKRKHSLTLAISTPATDTDSIMFELVELGRAGEAGFYYKEFSAPMGCEVDDHQAWYAANPALDDFLFKDGLRASLRTSRESTFRRQRLGQWVAIEGSWLPEGAWAACAKPGTTIAEGARVVLGVDGSFSGDATAIVAASQATEPQIELFGLWEAPEGVRDWRVPVEDVEEGVRQACKRWKVDKICFDPYRWQRSMQVLEAERMPVVEFPQSPQRMTPATTRFYEAVVNQALTHSGDARLSRHIANCVLRQDPRGARVTKEHKHSQRRIDAAVAAIMAFSLAAVTVPEPPPILVAWR